MLLILTSVLYFALNIYNTVEGTSSYLLCYKDGEHDVEYINGTTIIQCKEACISFDDVCFCKENFNWKYQHVLVWGNKTCNDFACDKNIAIKDAHSTALVCPNPKDTLVFDITTWIELKQFINFLFFIPGQVIDVFTKFTINIAYTEAIENSFQCDFGDGYQIELSTPTCNHIYSLPGVYNVTVEVLSSKFPSFLVSVKVTVKLPLSSVILESCSSSHVTMSRSETKFNCTGLIKSGSDIKVAWDFQENGIETYNITSASMFVTNPSPCIFSCDSSLIRTELLPSLKDIIRIGTFLLPNAKFVYDGSVSAIELYGRKQGFTSFQIYRLVHSNYQLVYTTMVPIYPGYMLFEFSGNSPNVQAGDIIGFYLEDMDLLQALNLNSSFYLEYYEISQSSNFILPDLIIHNVTFQVHVISTAFSYVYIEYWFKFTGFHDIVFQATDLYGSSIQSNKYQVAVTSHVPILKPDNNNIEAVATKPHSICVTIEHGAYVDVTWSTLSTSVIQILHDTETPFTKYSRRTSVTEAALEIVECIVVKMMQSGNFVFDVEVSVNNLKQDAVTKLINTLPAITGLEFTYWVSHEPFYQLKSVFLSGSVTPYPYPLDITWNYGNGELNNFTTSIREWRQEHVYLNHGLYNISLTAQYKSAFAVTTGSIYVHSLFEIIGPNITCINVNVTFIVTSKIPVVNMTYSWFFGYGAALSTNQIEVSSTYPTAGIYHVKCKILTEFGIVERSVNITVLEPITGLAVGLKPKSRPFASVNFTLKASYLTGNELSFVWSSVNLTIIAEMDSEVLVYSNKTGTHEISVFVSNDRFNGSKSFFIELISDYLYFFSVAHSHLYVAAGESVTFYVITSGALLKTKSFEFIFLYNNETIETTNTNLSKSFQNPGTYKVYIRLKMNGDDGLCDLSTIVPCQLKTEVIVQDPIRDLLFLLLPGNGEDITANATINVVSRINLHFQVTALNGTDVEFKVTVDNLPLTKINGSPYTFNTTADVVLSKTIFWDIKTYICCVNVSNKVSYISRKFYVQTDEYIQANLSIDLYAETNKTTLLQVNVTEGSNIHFIWRMGNATVSSYVPHLYWTFKEQRTHVVNVTMINPISMLSISGTITVIIPMSGIYLSCPSSAIKTGDLFTITYGFTSGQNVTVTLLQSQQANQTLGVNVNAPYKISHKMRFYTDGVYFITISSTNPADTLHLHHCPVAVQDAINSISMILNPSSTTYAMKDVFFTVYHYYGTNVTGTLEITTHNNLYVAKYPLQLKPCQIGTSCGNATVRHAFEYGGFYHISGKVENEISHVNISPQDMLVVEFISTSKVNDYIEVIAISAIIGSSTKIHVVKKNNIQFDTCTMRFGENNKMKILDLLSLDVIEHKYSSIGKYNIALNCTSPTEILNLQTEAYVQHKINISNVNRPLKCVKYGDNVNISVEVSLIEMMFGLEIFLAINYTNVQPNFQIEQEKYIVFMINKNLLTSTGSVVFSIKLQNRVSTATAAVSVCVAKPMESFKCQIPTIARFGMKLAFQVSVISETPVYLNFNFGDGSSLLSTTSNIVYTYDHHYIDAGIFNYTVHGSNPVSSMYCNGLVDLIKPISNVSIDHPKMLLWPNNLGEFSLHFVDELASNSGMEYQIYYGDHQHTDFLPLEYNSTDSNQTIRLKSHNYNYPGCFAITVMIRNRVNSLVLKSNLTIISPADMRLSISSEYGNQIDAIFRDDFPLLVSISNLTDSCFIFNWIVTNFNTSEAFESSTVTPSFFITQLVNKPGIYNLAINATVPTYYFILSSAQFTLQSGIPDLIVIPATLGTYQHREFAVITKSDPSVISSLNWDFGDGTTLSVNPTFVTILKDNELFLQKFDYVFTSKTVYMYNTSHLYLNEGWYTATVFAENEISRSESSKNVLISGIYCKRPFVQILIPLNKTLTFHYQQHISVLSTVYVNCSRYHKVFYHWKVFKSTQWEMDNGISSTGKQSISFTKTDIHHSSLEIIKRTLVAGVYIFKVDVLLDEVNLDHSDEISVIIIEDNLKATIKGGFLRQLNWQKDFMLDASDSLDPNEINQPNLDFEWYCKKDNKTDCFGNGEGLIEFFGTKWLIKGKSLLEGVAYEFRVVVENKLKGRKTEAYQKIVLIDKEIPIITIRCKFNCREFANPSQRLSLIGQCHNCDSQSAIDFLWTDVSIHGSVDFSNDLLTQPSSSNLVVRPGALSGGLNYKIGLKVTKSSGISSFSEYYIKTNIPPYGGTCSVSPLSGTSLKTTFSITCRDWVVLVGTLNYRVLMFDKNSQKLLSYSPQQKSTMMLPNGLEVNDYVVTLKIEIIDSFGGTAAYELSVKVFPFVQKATIDVVQEELLNMTTGDDNVLDRLSDEGDTQGLMQLINTVTETINLVQVLKPKQNITNVAEEEDSVKKRTEIRTAMLEVLSEVPVHSVENAKQTADAIGPLLQTPEEVSPETQELALKSFTNITIFLEEDEELKTNESPEEIADITSGLVKATGNLLQAIVKYDLKNKTVNKTGSVEVKSVESQKKERLAKNALNVVDKILPLLFNGKVAGEKPTRIAGDTIALELSRKTAGEFGGDYIETLHGGSFKLPTRLFADGNGSVILDSKMSTLIQNPFSWHSSSFDVSAPITSFSFSTENNTGVPVEDLPEDKEIEMFIPQHAVISKISVNTTSNTNQLAVYKVTVTEVGVALVCNINVTENPHVELFIRRGVRPTINRYDAKFMFNATSEMNAVFTTWANISSYYLGVSAPYYDGDNSQPSYAIVEMELFTTGCLFLNELTEVWESRGCRVGPHTNKEQTHCLCNHLTWFGSNLYIPPNQLDIKAEIMKLRNIGDFPALLATFCTLCCVYVIALIWARRKDSLDTLKGTPTFLKSQSSLTGTVYHVSVYTGHRGGSGTSAIPILIMSGKTVDSQPIVLKSDERVLFERGSVETFILKTDVDIGDLLYVTIWHDDGGVSPGWFLSRLVITNLDNNKQYVCFCNDWLAVDQSDGAISRVLPVAFEQELRSFENIFLAKTARDLTDGHLWFSIVSRPPRSNFTRMQRVSCCLCLLLSTMLSNAMFYRVTDDRPVGDEIDVSGFKISWSQIVIGVQSSLIVLPMNVLIVYLFRQAKPSSLDKKHKEKKKVEKLHQVVPPRKEDELYDVTLRHSIGMDIPSQKKRNKSSFVSTSFLRNTTKDSTQTFQGSSLFQIKESPEEVVWQVPCASSSTITPSLSTPSKQDAVTISSVNLSAMSLQLPDQVQYWPGWVKYLAWFLCVLTSFISGFFTLLYGLSFGRRGQEEWLFSFFVSVFSDIIFNQPIKVVILAAVVTIVLRKLKDEYIQTEIENYRNFECNTDDDETALFVHHIHRPVPPSVSYIKKTRKKRLYESKMVDIVLEITFYVIYLSLCLLITYGHRDPDAYAMTNNIENIFIRNKFDEITSIPDFWSWTNNALSSGLIDDEWYNGQKVQHNGFLSDTASYILGTVRMRQVRVKEESCDISSDFGFNISTCGFSYSDEHEDTTPQYCDNWKLCGVGESALYPKYWKYSSSDDTGSYTTAARLATYSGGGYLAELGKTKGEIGNLLTYLSDNAWLDDKSRAVFTEFTAYNTHANFYVMVLMLMEIPATGGTLVFKRVLTTRLDRYSSGFAIFLGACEIAFLGFTLFYMYRELKKILILKWKYLKDWRNWIEIIGFTLIWTSFALLMVRFGLVTVVKNQYFQDPNKFVNFENAALSDQAYGYVLAFVAVLVVVKFLKILRFNQKMLLMFRTVLYASKDLKYFTVSFILAFLAFTHWSHLLLMRSLEGYSNFIVTIESLFNLMLGKFDYYAIVTADELFGRIFFVVFIFFMTYILLNMFISIIIEAFASVQQKTRGRKNKYELIDFLTQRVKGYLPASLTRKKNSEKARLNPGNEHHESTEYLIEKKKRKQPNQLETPNPLDALEKAIDRIDAYVEHMLEEEEFEVAMLELILKIVESKKQFDSTTTVVNPELGGSAGDSYDDYSTTTIVNLELEDSIADSCDSYNTHASAMEPLTGPSTKILPASLSDTSSKASN